MFGDANFKHDPTPKNMAAGTADQVSTNVYDAGAAKNLFAGTPVVMPKLNGAIKVTAGTGALSVRVRYVGADNAALTANPVIIADTGVILVRADGTALAIGDVVPFSLPLFNQQTAKEFYGAIYTLGTADQDGEVTAMVVMFGQTNMPVRKAAVP
jgi:hypothetical protein